jgi:hypothetical protein
MEDPYSLRGSFPFGAQAKGGVPMCAMFGEPGLRLGLSLLLGQWAFVWAY